MATREGEPGVKQPTVPAPHPLAELIAQMLTGVAHVPRVEQARMVADAAKAAAKWHNARVAELEQRDAGRVEMLATACEQITELKAERDRLRDKNARYRDVLEEISNGFGYPGNARTPEELSANQMMQMAEAALAAKEVG